MILTYSKEKFKTLILSGEKIHTIREDAANRWKPGMSIQHWMHNPRNVSKNPHEFSVGVCNGTQAVVIMRHKNEILVWIEFEFELLKLAKPDEIEQLAKNDGLTLEEFKTWFVPNHRDTFKGKIIHFTNLRY